MSRVIRQTPLEIYVKQWLKANTILRKSGFDLLRKAAAYINEKIAADCCDPLDPVINLYTNKESVFVRDVYTMLYGMSRNGNIQSLTRTRDAILNYVNAICCDNVVLLGDLYNVSAWNNLVDFTNTTGFSVVSNKIVAAPDAGGTQELRLNSVTMLDQDSISITFVWNSTSGSDRGIGVSFRSINTFYAESVVGYVSLTADANFGKVAIINTGGPTTHYSATAPLASTQIGDVITITLTNDKQQYTLSAVNHTKGTTGTVSIVNSFIFTGENDGRHNAARVGINQTGGGYTIQNIKYSSPQPQSPALLVLGDSISQGMFAGSTANRWGEILHASIEAGIADATSEILQLIPQVINVIKPKTVLILAGVNDLLQSVSSATWQANYISIVSQLEAAGINVIKFTPLPTNQVDTTPFRTFLLSQYTDGTVIDSFTPFLGSGTTLASQYDAGDNLHVNQLGNAKLAKLALDSGKIYG